MEPLLLVSCYLISVNLLAFYLMRVDKKRAMKKRWRIPERTLFAVAIFGGTVGGLLGMRFFRHKTKHLSFVLGFPIILILQIVIVIILSITKI